MITLTTDTNRQAIVFIPRGDFDKVYITDDQTNETTAITPFTFTEGEYYSTLEAEFALIENHFYNLVIKRNDSIIYRDRIFCTDQDLVTFSVNNGQYVSNSTTNEFIVYE
jgi:hypothetical protein